jgi:hypothetical protein
MYADKTLSITKGFVWYFNNSNLGRLAAVSETEKSSKELIENFDYKIGDYVEHRRMWSNIAWGWITVEVYKNKQLIHQFEFDNEVKKSISERQKFNDYADNQVKEFRRKHYGE